ncbi:hypothetical protein C8Q80DRAFT_1275327 [Daedaleopsis nitida]|nr:hypothetical protein C8Q80DRAFT_1275327 [Daedaleopsis nitida]
MGDISVENAELVGLWFQLLATGAYLTYFPQCVAVFRQNSSAGNRDSIWLHLACYLIFFSVIADQVLALTRTYQAFGVHGGVRPDPTAYYADPANSLAAAKNSFNIVLTLISDAIIVSAIGFHGAPSRFPAASCGRAKSKVSSMGSVYRTFVLWNHNVWVILLPVSTVLANIALGVLTIVALLQVKPGDNLIKSDITIRLRWYFVLTFLLNIVCAALICGKIWRINSRVARRSISANRDANSPRGPSYTGHVLDVIIQSAGLYCAHLLAVIITDAIGTNVFFIFLDPIPPVSAIIFSMLIVRARKTSSSSSFPGATVGGATVGTISMPTSPVTARAWNYGSYPARPNFSIGVTVDLERVVHTDRGIVHELGDVASSAEGFASRDRISIIEAKDIAQAV